jgi:hypothetical protein
VHNSNFTRSSQPVVLHLLQPEALLAACYVTQVSVKATGPNSLLALKLRGLAGAAVRKLLAEQGPGCSSGSSSSSNSVTMALKLAPPFHNTSAELQVGGDAASVSVSVSWVGPGAANGGTCVNAVPALFRKHWNLICVWDPALAYHHFSPLPVSCSGAHQLNCCVGGQP